MVRFRVLGYGWLLSHPEADIDDGVIYDAFTAETGMGWQEDVDAFLAFQQGVYDAVNATSADWHEDYVSPEDAAEIKGVGVNTLYRLLRNEARRLKFFPRAMSEGEGKRRVWHLHKDDVQAWRPGKHSK